MIDHDRFVRIMARLEDWANENEVSDCSADAEAEVEYLLGHNVHRNMTDDEIFDEACAAWLAAE